MGFFIELQRVSPRAGDLRHDGFLRCVCALCTGQGSVRVVSRPSLFLGMAAGLPLVLFRSEKMPRVCGTRPSGLLVQNRFMISPFFPWGDFPVLDPVPLMAKPTLFLVSAAVPVVRISTLLERDGVLPPFVSCHGRVRLRRDPFVDVLPRSFRGADNCGYRPASAVPSTSPSSLRPGTCLKNFGVVQ